MQPKSVINSIKLDESHINGYLKFKRVWMKCNPPILQRCGRNGFHYDENIEPYTGNESNEI